MLQLDPDLTETLCKSMPDMGVSSTSCTLINSYIKRFQRDQKHLNNLFLDELSCRKVFLERRRVKEQRLFDELTLVPVDGSDQVHEQLLKRRCNELNDVSREIILIESLIGKYATVFGAESELEYDDSLDLSTPISYDTFPRRASSVTVGVNRNDSMGSQKDVVMGSHPAFPSSSSSRLGRLFHHSRTGRHSRRSDPEMMDQSGSALPGRKKYSLASSNKETKNSQIPTDFDSKVLAYEKKSFFIHPNLRRRDRETNIPTYSSHGTKLERKGSTGSFGSIKDFEMGEIGSAIQTGSFRSLQRHLGKTNGVYMPSPAENINEVADNINGQGEEEKETHLEISEEMIFPQHALRSTSKSVSPKMQFQALQSAASFQTRVSMFENLSSQTSGKTALSGDLKPSAPNSKAGSSPKVERSNSVTQRTSRSSSKSAYSFENLALQK